MSPVKFVHVLKRLEILDRDIAELRALEDNLNERRSYSDSMRISVELQINHLLNERVKLMELRIENPPEYLIPEKRELEDDAARLPEKRGRFKLEDFEKEMTQPSIKVKPGKPMLSQEEADSLIEKTLMKKTAKSKQAPPPLEEDTPESRLERLKRLPTADY